MTKPTQWPCRGCGALLSGRGGKRYCGPHCRPRCSVDGCERPRHGNVYCSAHHTRWKKHGDPLAPLTRQPVKGKECSVDGCAQPMRKHPYCASHYGMWRRHGEIRPWNYRWADEPTCLVCGEINGGFRSRKFCSANCMVYWHRAKAVPPNPACARCGVEIDLAARGKKGQRRRRTVKLCSRCKAQSRTEATPDNSPCVTVRTARSVAVMSICPRSVRTRCALQWTTSFRGRGAAPMPPTTTS